MGRPVLLQGLHLKLKHVNSNGIALGSRALKVIKGLLLNHLEVIAWTPNVIIIKMGGCLQARPTRLTTPMPP